MFCIWSELEALVEFLLLFLWLRLVGQASGFERLEWLSQITIIDNSANLFPAENRRPKFQPTLAQALPS